MIWDKALSRLAIGKLPRRRNPVRRAAVIGLRFGAAALLLLAGLPLALGAGMLRAGGRGLGVAFELDKDE